MVETSWKQFSYVVFVARQILGVVGSCIKSERILSIASICINMQCSRLGIENFDMLVSIYKNWPNDSWVGTNVHGIVPRNGKNIDEGKWIQN
jgi:hypothetical protein